MSLTSEQNIKEKLWSNPIIATVLLVTLASVGVWQALDTVYAKLREAENALLITAKQNAESRLQNAKQDYANHIKLLKLSHRNELSQEKRLRVNTNNKLTSVRQNLEKIKQNIKLADKPNEETIRKLESERYVNLQNELQQKHNQLTLQKTLYNNLNSQLESSNSELAIIKEANLQLSAENDIIQTLTISLVKGETKVIYDGQLSIILKNVQELFTSGVRFNYTFQNNGQLFKVSGLGAGDSIARKDVDQMLLYVFTVIDFDKNTEEATLEIAKIKMAE